MADWRLKLLYDGECPICRREVQWLKSRDRAGRLALEDISAIGFSPEKYGLRAEDVNVSLHGILPDGRVVRRMEAVREAYRSIGLGWLAAPTGWPVLRPVFDRLYLLFARNRGRIGALLGRRCEHGSCSVER